MQLVLDTRGLSLRQRNRSFFVSSKTQSRIISTTRISSIAVTADCMISSAAIRLAARNQIPLYFINKTGKVDASLWSANFVGLASLRKRQAKWSDSTAALHWCIAVVILKIQRQQALLNNLGAKDSAERLNDFIEKLNLLADDFSEHTIRNTIFGIEGAAARLYWQALSTSLPKSWQFEKRSRRPARDMFNAALNYLYGMLYGTVETAIFSAGLDPFVGVLHAEEYKRPVLVFDCIEPFRPWVDGLVAEQFISNKASSQWFTHDNQSFALNKVGKAYLIPLFNDFLKSEKIMETKSTSVRNHLYDFAAILAQQIKHLSKFR